MKCAGLISGASANSWKYSPAITGESCNCSTVVGWYSTVPPGLVFASNGVTGRSPVPIPHPAGTVTLGWMGMFFTGTCEGYSSSFSHSSTAILSSARESTMQSRCACSVVTPFGTIT